MPPVLIMSKFSPRLLESQNSMDGRGLWGCFSVWGGVCMRRWAEPPCGAAASPCNLGLQGGRRQTCGAGSQEASFQMDGCQGPLCSGARAPDCLAAVGIGSVGFCAQWESPTSPPGLTRFCVLGHACSKQRERAPVCGAPPTHPLSGSQETPLTGQEGPMG